MKIAKELREDLELYAEFCEKHTLKAQDYGRSIAYHHFVMMVNPKYRGDNFSWKNFERMVVAQAKAGCWQSFSDKEWRRFGPLIEESAAHSAKLAAQEILRLSDVQNWMTL